MNDIERAALISDITKAWEEKQTCLTSEEQTWVKMAIAREANAVTFRRAVIEKTVIGLVWAALIWVGAAVLAYAKQELRA
jgi:hypothetical protein